MYRNFAKIYDRLAENDFNQGQWINYFNEVCSQYGVKPKTVVELGCGTGTLAIEFKKQGLEVWAIDNSIDMLDVAREKARNNGVSINFICQDMKEFEIHKPVDAIICFCDGVNYLENINEVRMMLQSCYRQLKPGGLLLFDLSTEFKLKCKLNEQTFVEIEDDLTFIWTNIYDEDEGVCQMDLTWFEKKPTGDYQRYDETHFQFIHNSDDIMKEMKCVGFSEINNFHEFSLQPSKLDSERIFYVAVVK